MGKKKAKAKSKRKARPSYGAAPVVEIHVSIKRRDGDNLDTKNHATFDPEDAKRFIDQHI